MRRHAFVVGLLHRAPKTLAYLQHCFTPTRLNNIFGRPVMLPVLLVLLLAFALTAATQPAPRMASSIREIGGLKAGHTFQEGLTALIASAMSGSLQKFLDEALDPDEIVRMRFIQVAFHGPYPQAMISIRSDNAKPPFGLWLAYSDIPAEMAEVNEWSNKGFQPDESGDLSQSMNISARTIIGLGEFLRIEGAST